MQYDFTQSLERAKARKDARKKRDEESQRWHRWFAWHPIAVGECGADKTVGTGIWLETVERKAEFLLDHRYGWSYRRPAGTAVLD